MIEEAEVIEPNPELEPQQEKMNSQEAEVIEKMMKNLPKELIEEQRSKVKKLL